MSSVFSRIVSGEIPSYKVAEDEFHLAFLDISPLRHGHVLCIPKKETDHLFDLPIAEYNSFMEFTYKVAAAIKKAIPSERIGVVVAGFEVPHAHVHLIPVNHMKEMEFSNPKLSVAAEDMVRIASLISSYF